MRGGRRVALSLFAGLCLSNAAYGEPQIAPYQMVRSLQFLQENITLGSQASQQAQQKLLVQMTDQFLAVDPAVWQDRKNFAAAIIHALSGGDPAVLRQLVKQKSIAEVDMPLVTGTLAYAEGKAEEASGLLLSVNARMLDATLGGYVALTQSALVAARDPKRAGQLLDLARLLMPGTLVEEASLRREITAVVQDGDIEKFERLSRQQLTRFGRSLYAVAFRSQFVDALIKLDYSEQTGRLQVIADILSALPPRDQREVYLLIAQRAVMAGKMAVARFAADHATRLAIGTGPDEARAQLYAAAALIVTDDFDTALQKLKAIDRSALTPEDSQLLESALVVAARLREWPKPPVPDETRQPREAVASEDAKSMGEIAGRVKTAIERTDEFLKAQTQ